jgi:hypothetical protein
LAWQELLLRQEPEFQLREPPLALVLARAQVLPELARLGQALVRLGQSRSEQMLRA